MKCLKALYGHMEASRLFYNDLDHSLTEKMNFVRNKYDTCVYNRRNENGEVTTIKAHVNDLKVPSKSKTNLDRVVKELEDIYEEIMVHEGNTHNYLGMIMTYDKEKKCVRINMEKSIEEIINVFKENEPDEKIKTVMTPATNNLFKARGGGVNKVSKQRAGNFHATVAFCCKESKA